VDDLVARMRETRDRLRLQMREHWARDVPFEDLVFDRWERARALGFGANTSIYQSSYLYGDVKVGHDTWIGPFTLLDGSGGLTIGNWCSISTGVHVYTHDTVARALSAGRVGPEVASVAIGDSCYIGAQSVIAKGVTIGERSVVGANSFVNRDVPAFTVVAGTPARRLGIVIPEGDNFVIRYDADP
jgi:acetyltransferase-like isoleucine patch superfamily enzyme